MQGRVARMAERAPAAKLERSQASADRAVQGERAGSPDYQEHGYGQGQQMVFVPFALLRAGPVHEQTIDGVNFDDGYQHVYGDAESRNPGEEPEDQAQPSEELGGNRQECQ